MKYLKITVWIQYATPQFSKLETLNYPLLQFSKLETLTLA